MINFSSEYFQKFNFSPRQLNAYVDSVRHQLEIAESSQVPEVMFEFAYNALIKFVFT